MKCECSFCKRSDWKQCRSCGRDLCIQHWKISQGCGRLCKVDGQGELPTETRTSYSRLPPVTITTTHSSGFVWGDFLSGLLRLIGFGLLLAVSGFVWWALVPTFVDLANTLGDDDGPFLPFPFDRIVFFTVFFVVLGFFLIPPVVIWSVCQSLYERVSDHKDSPPQQPLAKLSYVVQAPPSSTP
jgi:hypothetical protein